MTEFIGSLLPIIDWLGPWFYLLTFIFCFLESLAFVGTLFPGSVLMLATGFLTAYGSFEVGMLAFVAAGGASIGDGLSYWLGTKGKRWFNCENKLLKLGHLEKAEQYFKKHGDKSVFLGRFIGLIRPIIPFVAGLSKMELKKFLFWSILSALLWSVSHLGLGYLVGRSLDGVRLPLRPEVLLVVVPIAVVALWLALERRRARRD